MGYGEEGRKMEGVSGQRSEGWENDNKSSVSLSLQCSTLGPKNTRTQHGLTHDVLVEEDNIRALLAEKDSLGGGMRG